MKIHRFHVRILNRTFLSNGRHVGGQHSYGYIVCHFWQVPALRRRAKEDSGLLEVTWEPGPKTYGARFIITAKRKPNG